MEEGLDCTKLLAEKDKEKKEISRISDEIQRENARIRRELSQAKELIKEMREALAQCDGYGIHEYQFRLINKKIKALLGEE